MSTSPTKEDAPQPVQEILPAPVAPVTPKQEMTPEEQRIVKSIKKAFDTFDQGKSGTCDGE
jgi:hypothetical protein